MHRPTPSLRHHATPITRQYLPHVWAERLRAGERLLVTDHYATGERVLRALDALLPAPPNTAPYADRQAHRRALREASLGLLAPIEAGRAAFVDGSHNGFLRELYPELSRFFLPFIEVQELHGAWTRYEEGVHLAVLGRRLHPYYGTYAPTRTSHLELFATWLSAYRGARGRAVDVGTGSGVLAFLLAKAGVSEVLATDVNPNAIESVRRDAARVAPPPPIRVAHGDLLTPVDGALDLIVFNPPWIRGEPTSPLDQALYFDDALFPRFFDQALDRLAPEGRIVLVFSNVNDLVRPEVDHPIEAELAAGRLALVQRLQRRVTPPSGPNGERRRSRERVEVWELDRAGAQPAA